MRHHEQQPLPITSDSMSGQAADQQPCKKQKVVIPADKSTQDDELKRFYRSWAWKREHR
jgi:hypothetical protein